MFPFKLLHWSVIWSMISWLLWLSALALHTNFTHLKFDFSTLFYSWMKLNYHSVWCCKRYQGKMTIKSLDRFEHRPSWSCKHPLHWITSSRSMSPSSWPYECCSVTEPAPWTLQVNLSNQFKSSIIERLTMVSQFICIVLYFVLVLFVCGGSLQEYKCHGWIQERPWCYIICDTTESTMGGKTDRPTGHEKGVRSLFFFLSFNLLKNPVWEWLKCLILWQKVKSLRMWHNMSCMAVTLRYQWLAEWLCTDFFFL